MVKHIFHIDGSTGSGSVVTTRKPDRRVRLNFFLGQFQVQGLYRLNLLIAEKQLIRLTAYILNDIHCLQ